MQLLDVALQDLPTKTINRHTCRLINLPLKSYRHACQGKHPTRSMIDGTCRDALLQELLHHRDIANLHCSGKQKSCAGCCVARSTAGAAVILMMLQQCEPIMYRQSLLPLVLGEVCKMRHLVICAVLLPPSS